MVPRLPSSAARTGRPRTTRSRGGYRTQRGCRRRDPKARRRSPCTFLHVRRAAARMHARSAGVARPASTSPAGGGAAGDRNRRAAARDAVTSAAGSGDRRWLRVLVQRRQGSERPPLRRGPRRPCRVHSAARHGPVNTRPSRPRDVAGAVGQARPVQGRPLLGRHSRRGGGRTPAVAVHARPGGTLGGVGDGRHRAGWFRAGGYPGGRFRRPEQETSRRTCGAKPRRPGRWCAV